MVSLNRFCRHCRQPVAVVLLFAVAPNLAFASNSDTLKPCVSQIARPSASDPTNQPIRGTADSDSTQPPGAGAAERNRAGRKNPGPCVARFAQSLLSDQKTIWTSPLHLHTQDRNWLVPFGVGTLGLVAADRDIMRHFGTSPVAHSGSFGNYGLAAMMGTAASLYLRGATSHDDHIRESGFLAGEAALNSVIVGETMKLAFRRPRPYAVDAGTFGAGGASFPSEHALVAWSIASVIAHEHPGPLTKLLAYSAASGISLSRVSARQHFPSDVIVGSALGFLIGRHVRNASMGCKPAAFFAG